MGVPRGKPRRQEPQTRPAPPERLGSGSSLSLPKLLPGTQGGTRVQPRRWEMGPGNKPACIGIMACSAQSGILPRPRGSPRDGGPAAGRRPSAKAGLGSVYLHLTPAPPQPSGGHRHLIYSSSVETELTLLGGGRAEG